MSNSIDQLISQAPFSLTQEEKAPLFHAAMKEAFTHHISSNPLFERYCSKKSLDLDSFPYDLSELPYIPINIFKSKNLSSVSEENITKTLHSSATSGVPSTILIDPITSKRQTQVSAKVMSEFLGNHRRPFLILDEDPGKTSNNEQTARTAATTGFVIFSNDASYLLTNNNGDLSIDLDQLTILLQEAEISKKEVTILGFTYILYHHVVRILKEKGVSFSLPKNSKVIHIGGWKKLESQKVSKRKFCEDTGTAFGVSYNNIVDFYGFTEQMGLVYGNQGLDPKPLHNYAEIIIRDIQTLQPTEEGKEGFIQILTPIPNSYPGISILTEDIGRIVDIGPNPHGFATKRFEIIGRAEKAEVRGCGDIMSEVVIS